VCAPSQSRLSNLSVFHSKSILPGAERKKWLWFVKGEKFLSVVAAAAAAEHPSASKRVCLEQNGNGTRVLLSLSLLSLSLPGGLL